MSYKIDLVIDSKVALGETPIWNDDKSVLYWTDVFAGDFYIFDVKTGENKVFKLGKMIGSAIPCESGDVLLLLEDGIFLFDIVTGEKKLLVNPEPGNDANRLNDGRCDERGRVWFSTVSKAYGSPEYDESMTGGLYMMDTDLSLKKVMDGINQLNGIGWSVDGTKMYVVDTHNFRLLQFNYDARTGNADEMKILIEFPEEYGFADGLCIDENDNVWIAHWASKVTRWDLSTGKLVEAIEMPVPNITCTGFGGENFDEMYITTSNLGISEEDLKESPLGMSGGMFKINPSVKGRQIYKYKG